MILPDDRTENGVNVGRIQRHGLFRNTIRLCDVSRDDRKARNRRYRSFYLTGTDTNDRVRHNKLKEHVKFSSSYLYDPNSVRFGVSLPPHYGDQFLDEEEIIRAELHRIWDDSPDPITLGIAVDWAHVWDTVILKVYVAENQATISLVPETGDVGVLDESMDRWEDQEAVCHWYSLSIPQLRRVMVQHPDAALARRVMEAAKLYAAPMQEPQSMALPPAVERIILASASPNMVGQVQNMADSLLALPRVGEPVVPMAELWVWDDYLDDYRVVTNFLKTEDIIWERPNPLLRGDHPFYGLTLGPTPGYLWGICPLEDLIGLQAWQDQKVKDLDTRDDLQIKPPTFFKGFTGITDEIAERFNAPNANLSSGNPTAEIQRLGPQPLPDPFGMLDRIDMMFARQGGLPRQLTGQADANVRSEGQAQTQAVLGAGPTFRLAMYVERCLAELATAKLRLHRQIYAQPLIKSDGAKFLLSQVPEEIRARVWAHSQSPVYAQRLMEKATLAITHKAITPEDYLELLDLPMGDILRAKGRRLAKSQAAMQEKMLELKEKEVQAKVVKAMK